MDERGQFTFYRSYWDAIGELPAKQQLPILKAIIRYALFGEEPADLSSVCRAVFLLVKPTLDSSRKKASNGKQGGSKPKANSKQTPSEKEKEEEKENEIEGEKEKEQTESAPHSGKPFTSFWDAYPKKIDRSGAWEAWKALNPSEELARQILSSLDAWCKSSQWTEDGGRYIPDAAKFLTKGYWQSMPAPTTAQHGSDRLAAMIGRGDFDD